MAPSPSVEGKDILNFAKKLAANEKTQRDRAVKKLKKWLRHKSESSMGMVRFSVIKSFIIAQKLGHGIFI